MTREIPPEPEQILCWELSKDAYEAFDSLRWRLHLPTPENTVTLLEDLDSAFLDFPELSQAVDGDGWSLLTYCVVHQFEGTNMEVDYYEEGTSCDWDSLAVFFLRKNPYALLWNYKADGQKFRACRCCLLDVFLDRQVYRDLTPMLLMDFPWLFARKDVRDATGIHRILVQHHLDGRYPASYLKRFYEIYPECISDEFLLGVLVNNPFHRTCCPKLYKWILEQCPPGTLTRVCNDRGLTALHHACEAMDTINDECAADLAEITQLLMSKCPQAIIMECPAGRSPLREYVSPSYLLDQATTSVQRAHAKILAISMLKTLHSAYVLCEGSQNPFGHGRVYDWADKASRWSFFVTEVEWKIMNSFEGYDEGRVMRRLSNLSKMR